MRRWLIFTALLAAGSPVAASAHAFLDHAVPAVGATVPTAPRQVQMFFTQQLEAAFSGAAIADAGGKTIATGAATVDPRNPMALVLNLPSLSPGRYRVSWHVVSVDTHRTEGSFSFEIRP
jgi:methionine-rich copper-binding protein CopC